MTLTVSDIFIGVLLISCVPIQYLIVQNWGSSQSYRSYTLKKLVTYLTNSYDEYLTFDSWWEWLFQIMKILKFEPSYGSDDDGESPAVEVMKYKQGKEFFAMSPDPRLHRSPYVEFHVGQVVMHKTLKFKGVIIGWDETAKAPADWIAEMDAKNKKWKSMPNYSILIDTRDRLSPQLTYVSQENIEVIKSTKIIHPLIEHYFESYDGTQYIPRPWLQTVYPQD